MHDVARLVRILGIVVLASGLVAVLSRGGCAASRGVGRTVVLGRGLGRRRRPWR